MINRGDIYYVTRTYTEEGSEQQAGRPAVIVSNDTSNANSTVVEVVYLTTQPKAALPTHCIIESSSRQSTALCEQITSVHVRRLDGYIGTVTQEEMLAIDRCLAVSLSLNTSGNTELKLERDMYKRQYEELLDKLVRR